MKGILGKRQPLAMLIGVGLMTLNLPVYGQDNGTPTTVEFTLITGDKVVAFEDSKGALFGVRLLDENGTETLTSLQQQGENLYLIPPKAWPWIEQGSLDRELFNLTRMHKAGYDDASTPDLPLIIEYREGSLPKSALAATLPGAKLTARFEVIDSLAMRVSKSEIQELLTQLDATSAIQGVWLDAAVEAHKPFESRRNKHWWSHFYSTDEDAPTVPLTGAYGATASAYDGSGVTVAVLDTGYDTTHPDLAGRVVASQSFVWPYTSVRDLNGHGTHTASTVAGTGVASDGRYAGMAPGADLLIAKVLGDNGSGSTSGILSAMQWAVDSGADIVNMSLGGSSYSCSGPLVEMVEALSDEALFVISAGNSFTRETVGVPGCAPSALTVGAVDRQNNTATFSSRGPSPDGHSLKPDIASQGVNVIAAASGGKGETAYRALSGTSMAAPHVAGGAALLRQARPDLTPRQLKAVLTSAAARTDADVLEQGAGPMNVDRAIRQPVIAQPGQELGLFTDALNGGAVRSEITIDNLSNEAIELNLSLTLTGEDGKSPIPTKAAWLDIPRVTIAANSSAAVPIWINPDIALHDSAYGTIGGRLVGERQGGGTPVSLTVPVSYWVSPPMVDLTINAYDRHGKPAGYPSKFYILNHEDSWAGTATFSNGSKTLSLPRGDYSIVSYIMTYDHQGNSGGLVRSAAMMAQLGQNIDQDTVITFDAGQAAPVEFVADQPTSPQGFSLGFTYGLSEDDMMRAGSVEIAPDYVTELYGWSRGQDPHLYTFMNARALAPETRLTTGSGTVIDYTKQGVAQTFHGSGSAEVVVVYDKGYQTDWDSHDIAGKVVLLEVPYYLSSTSIKAIAERGAVGVIGARPSQDGRFKYNVHSLDSIPVVAVDGAQARALLAEAAQGPMTLSWSGIAPERSPYLYNLSNQSQGKIETGRLTFVPASADQGQADGLLGKRKLVQRDAHYYTQGSVRPVWTDMQAQLAGINPFFAGGTPLPLMTPTTRTEYYSAGREIAWTDIVMPRYTPRSAGALFEGARVYSRGKKADTSWFKAPRGGATMTSGSALAYRDTNQLELALPNHGDAFGHDGINGQDSSTYFTSHINGEKVNPSNGALLLPDETAQISLTTNFALRYVGASSSSNEILGTEFLTEYRWFSDSSLQGPQPILVPEIDLPVSMANTLPAGVPVQARIGAITDLDGPVDLSGVEVQYAYGDECRIQGYVYQCQTLADTNAPWHSAELLQRDGQWYATLPNAATPGQYVHLKVRLTGLQGSETEQTTVRAYLLD